MKHLNTVSLNGRESWSFVMRLVQNHPESVKWSQWPEVCRCVQPRLGKSGSAWTELQDT